jgi:2-methylaconitate cis-trans-isomerase PrpF
MRKFPVIYMRGGTSKGCMFLKKDLPEDRSQWDHIFLQVMGGPDPKQIDGMGGTVSSNNKILIVSPSSRPDADVDYLVAQVVVGKPIVDYTANCGNMTAAVGPFSVMTGLVPAVEPVTKIRMYNENSGKVIEEFVPVKDGQVEEDGDCSIAGIDGTAAELKVNFLNPAGAKTGKLLPTGSVRDEVLVEGLGKTITVSAIDISNIFVFIRASDLGMRGDELPAEIAGNKALLENIECVRGKIAQKCGLVEKWQDAAAKSAGSPKVVLFSEPRDYTDIAGRPVKAEDMDICVRVISVGQPHKASPMTAATAIGGAAFIDGCVMASCLRPVSGDYVRIAHPSGTMKVYVDREGGGDDIRFRGIAGQRTARKIMEGTIYIKD